MELPHHKVYYFPEGDGDKYICGDGDLIARQVSSILTRGSLYFVHRREKRFRSCQSKKVVDMPSAFLGSEIPMDFNY